GSPKSRTCRGLTEEFRMNDIEPMAWLTDTLEKLPSWPNSRIDELLPLKPLNNPA
ncbi:MAG: transposase domain-containing protein, partial [Accumulibacter sp.]|uniref:transposase domain-containing protein n=1 Tax=Accumulibacter sp. TaxID=2053492 RepID=UPI003315EBBE